MKYIRTINGRIIDLSDCELDDENEEYYYYIQHDDEYGYEIRKNNILKQADTIEELIMPGDLVRVGLTMVLVEKDRGDELRGIDLGLIKRNAVQDLWLGNEDEEKFIKCATKKEGDDHLTLCD